MPDNEQNNNTSDTENNNTDNQQPTAQGGGGGHIFAFGMDSNAQSDMSNVEKMKATLENCGNQVHFTQIGPNQETYLPAKAKEVNADVCIFACLVAPATIWSFGEAVKAGTLPHTIFAIEGWMAQANSLEDVRNTPWEPEHDAGQFMDSSSTAAMQAEGKTVGEWVDNNSEHISICYGNSPEELAQNICDGVCGVGGGGGAGTASGGAAQIKDKTFEDCIKRICAATDSVFVVENNAAVLFPYTDWMAFTLRQKINTIKRDQMDPDLFSIEYNTDGFYNKVTTVYGATEESSMETTNNNTDNNTTVDTETDGKVTKTRKSMPKGGTTISKQYDSLVKIYGELEKQVTTNFPDEETAEYVANALLIQYIRDFNNSCNVRSMFDKNYIGGTFYNVEHPNKDETNLYYLNSYVVYKEKNQPITIDFEFKYGPEGAEELLDYQNYGGNNSMSGAGGGTPGGESANINALAQQICQGLTDEIQKMTAVHNYLKDNIDYDFHECTRYNSPDECLQHMDDLNCADTSRLTRAVMSAAGLNAEVVHGEYHFWTIVTIGGKEYASDAVSSSHAINEVWNQGPFDYHEKCGDAPCC